MLLSGQPGRFGRAEVFRSAGPVREVGPRQVPLQPLEVPYRTQRNATIFPSGGRRISLKQVVIHMCQ